MKDYLAPLFFSIALLAVGGPVNLVKRVEAGAQS